MKLNNLNKEYKMYYKGKEYFSFESLIKAFEKEQLKEIKKYKKLSKKGNK